MPICVILKKFLSYTLFMQNMIYIRPAVISSCMEKQINQLFNFNGGWISICAKPAWEDITSLIISTVNQRCRGPIQGVGSTTAVTGTGDATCPKYGNAVAASLQSSGS